MIISGFHAIEERIRSFSKNPQNIKSQKPCIYYSKLGPRVKKIVEEAKKIGIICKESSTTTLDKMVENLNTIAKDHRGIVLEFLGNENSYKNIIDLDDFFISKKDDVSKTSSVVMILDSVTDPHNVGAIMRSCDQFGVDLLVLPERHSAKDGEVVARASSGAVSWIKTSIVTNLNRCVEKLKENGYWIYGSDAGGSNCSNVKLTGKICIIMGSEGKGISRLLQENCDGILSIPTCGKVDSLNVSVAAGILLYEVFRQNA